MPTSRAKIYWIAAVVFGLSISLPLALAISIHQPPENTQGVGRWGAPLVAIAGVLCCITLALACHTLRLFRKTARLARDMRQASDAALDAAAEANNVSRATVIASSRAWIHTPEITVGFQGLAFFPEDRPSIGVSASIGIVITNVGNAPATFLNIHAWLTVLREKGRGIALQQSQRADEIRSGAFLPGRTLFPGEVYPDNVHANAEIPISVGVDEIRAAMAESEDGEQVTLYVIGCIDYTFPAHPLVHHQTGFIRQLGAKDACAIRPKEGTHMGSDLLVIRHTPIDLLRGPD